MMEFIWRFRYFFTALVVITVLFSCSRRASDPDVNTRPVPAEEEAGQSIGQPAELSFTDTEKARIAKLRAGGGLRAATLLSRDNYFVEDDGSESGFDFLLSGYFCELLDIPLVLDVQHEVAAFFMLDGVFNDEVISDQSMVYTPDLLEENDIYIIPLTITPWRERLIRIIPMKPAGMGLYGRNAENLNNPMQLEGQSVAVLSGSFTDNFLSEYEEEYGFSSNKYNLRSTDTTIDIILAGEADFALEGLALIAKNVSAHPELSLSSILMMKVTTGWGVARDDEVLAGIISKLVEYSLANGRYQELFEETYDVDFDFYIELLRR